MNMSLQGGGLYVGTDPKFHPMGIDIVMFMLYLGGREAFSVSN
jgi:hypothetical protein